MCPPEPGGVGCFVPSGLPYQTACVLQVLTLGKICPRVCCDLPCPEMMYVASSAQTALARTNHLPGWGEDTDAATEAGVAGASRPSWGEKEEQGITIKVTGALRRTRPLFTRTHRPSSLPHLHSGSWRGKWLWGPEDPTPSGP